MLEHITAKITRKDRIPVYQERANYHRKRAILDSMQNGIWDFLDVNVQSVTLIDPANAIAIDLPNQSGQIEFAFDENNLAFARIKDGKYFPINIDKAKKRLKIADQYDKNARSAIQRIFGQRLERFDDVIFNLGVSIDNLNDTITLSMIKLYAELEILTSEVTRNQEKSGDIILLSAATKHATQRI